VFVVCPVLMRENWSNAVFIESDGELESVLHVARPSPFVSSADAFYFLPIARDKLLIMATGINVFVTGALYKVPSQSLTNFRVPHRNKLVC
jgi:hypothetical protein